MYTRLAKIRNVATTLPWLSDDPCVDFYKIGDMSVGDLRACLPKGVGKTTAPHINNWLKNGIEDVNQVMSEIRYLECKYLYHMQPDEWTQIMYAKATSLLCTVKRRNAKILNLVAKYLYKTTADDVKDHCPGVIYTKSSFERGNKEEVQFSENWINMYLINSFGLVTQGTTFKNMPFLCGGSEYPCKLVTRTHNSMHTEQVVWMSDVDDKGYYTSGSLYSRVVGKYADGTDKTQACDLSSPIWFDPHKCLVSDLVRMNRADLDL